MNQKGVTIVELLIVIVIMSIVASFTMVTVDSIVRNAKADSFVNSADAMINAASLAYDSGESIWNDNTVTLQELINTGYIDIDENDPWDENYNTTESYVTNDGSFKVTLISGYASIGYSDPLETYDTSDIIYATGNGGTVIDGIIENLTGVVTSSITGDNKNDSITVDGETRSANINTYGGDDEVTVNGDIRANTSVNTGEGDDTITITNRTRGNSTVDSGEGDDVVTITEMKYRTTLYTRGGNDTVTVGNLSTNFVGSISLGADDDSLTLGATYERLAPKSITIDGGSGNDTLILSNVTSAQWDDISSLFIGFEIIQLSDTTLYL